MAVPTMEESALCSQLIERESKTTSSQRNTRKSLKNGTRQSTTKIMNGGINHERRKHWCIKCR